MMFVGETPWHGLGTKLETAPSTGKEALIAAGLDWGVKRETLAIEANGQRVEHKAIVREDTGALLGVVGPNYRPYQNDQMASLYDPLIRESKVTIETAGSLQGGKRVWMLGKLAGDDMDITGKGDTVAKYLMLAHGHDGSLAVRFGFTPIRVVCQNTLSAAIDSESSRMVKCLHTTNLERNLETLRDTMVLADEVFELTAEQYRSLAKRGVSRVELREFARIVHDVKETDTNKWSHQQRAKIRETVAAAVEGKGNDGRTWWAAYNGATEWLSYNYGRNQESRVNHTWFGGGQNFNADALKLALQMSS